MSNITFDKEAKGKHKKEDIEWLRIWCPDVNDEKLPRVALIGDSITEGYYPIVRDALKDVAKVDYLATSYSIDSEMYHGCVRNFVKDSVYDVVHFNYGLHASVVDADTYGERCKEILEYISAQAKTVVATTTTVLDETLQRERDSWVNKVVIRNDKLVSIAEELDLNIDDLYTLCRTFDVSKRNPDGVHFYESGYQELAENVCNSVKKLLGGI